MSTSCCVARSGYPPSRSTDRADRRRLSTARSAGGLAPTVSRRRGPRRPRARARRDRIERDQALPRGAGALGPGALLEPRLETPAQPRDLPGRRFDRQRHQHQATVPGRAAGSGGKEPLLRLAQQLRQAAAEAGAGPAAVLEHVGRCFEAAGGRLIIDLGGAAILAAAAPDEKAGAIQRLHVAIEPGRLFLEEPRHLHRGARLAHERVEQAQTQRVRDHVHLRQRRQPHDGRLGRRGRPGSLRG
jgi:hypothetical protein